MNFPPAAESAAHEPGAHGRAMPGASFPERSIPPNPLPRRAASMYLPGAAWGTGRTKGDGVDEAKMKEAWALVDKAIELEAKANQPGKSDNMKRIAAKAVDKKLDEAVRLEAEALA